LRLCGRGGLCLLAGAGARERWWDEPWSAWSGPSEVDGPTFQWGWSGGEGGETTRRNREARGARNEERAGVERRGRRHPTSLRWALDSGLGKTKCSIVKV
jgi:hypothetical protein